MTRVSMSGRARIGLTGAILTLALTGCATPAAVPSQPTPAATLPRPLGMSDPAKPPTAASGTDTSCDPYASLTPSSLPAPGNMPSGSTMDKILKRGRLIVGVDQNTFLFGYRDPATGDIVGSDIDIAREVARAIFGDPNKVQLVAITAAQRIPDVQNGTVDLVADTMTVNCTRKQQVNFSSIYYDAGQRVLVRADSKATGINDLGGQKVCAAEGSTSISNIAAAPSKPIPVSVADWTDCLVLLQQNQVAAISTDDTILNGLKAQDPQTKLVGAAFTDEPYGMAIAKSNPDLVRFVNAVLVKIHSNGRWADIYRKWLGPDGVPSTPRVNYEG
jgi:polar amino acid transport system substrate-binding protein